jgi:hypothetical protein
MEIHRSVLARLRRLHRERVYCACSEWSWSKYEILCYQWGSTPIVENAIAEKAMAYDWAWKRGKVKIVAMWMQVSPAPARNANSRPSVAWEPLEEGE